MKRQKANSLELGKQNILAKKVYVFLGITGPKNNRRQWLSCNLFVCLFVCLLVFFWGGEDKQGALSGLGEMVNFPFV